MINNCFTSCLTCHTSECRLKTLIMIFICLIWPKIHSLPKTGNSINFERLGKHLALFDKGGFNEKKHQRLKKSPLTQFETGEISEGKTVYVRKRAPILSMVNSSRGNYLLLSVRNKNDFAVVR